MENNSRRIEQKISLRHFESESERLGPSSLLLPCHHRVRSTPAEAEIVRHHSMPTFACNQWGSKKTRQSYSCLFELNNKRTHRGHCVSCVELLTEAFDTPERTIEDYYGLFLNVSDSDDVMEECSSKKDIASQLKAQNETENTS